jgi:hypothetical protein
LQNHTITEPKIRPIGDDDESAVERHEVGGFCRMSRLPGPSALEAKARGKLIATIRMRLCYTVRML